MDGKRPADGSGMSTGAKLLTVMIGTAIMVGLAVQVVRITTVFIEIWRDPVLTSGIVIDVRTPPSSVSYRVHVRFVDDQGLQHEFVAWTTYWRTWYAPDVGDTVPVRYLRSDPSLATVDTPWATFGDAFEAAVFVLLLAMMDFLLLSELLGVRRG